MTNEAAAWNAGAVEERDEVSSSDRKQIIWSSLIGSTVEWYDFLIYGTASALVFGKLFFPTADPLVGTQPALPWRSAPTPSGSSPGRWAA